MLFCRIIVEERSGNTRTHSACDAWGNILSANGTMADSLGTLNPLRYRSYVYDHETGLYYLQSRYYDPELGRFINADVYASTGQGLIGNNMFAYCNNDPVGYLDSTGHLPIRNAAIRMTDGVCSSPKPKTDNSLSIVKQILDACTDTPREGTTFSVGITASGNWGGSSGSWTGCISVDKSHNYALQETTALSGSSSAGVGASVGLTYTFTNAKNVQDLTGVSQSWGITLVEGVGASVDILRFIPASNPNDVNWGVSISIVLGAEVEAHAAENYTTSTESWNPLKKLKQRIFGD